MVIDEGCTEVPIQKSLGNIEQSMSGILDRLGLLRERLNVVLRPSSPIPEQSKTTGMNKSLSSPFVERLEKDCLQLAQIGNIVEDILSRLET
jgi:hypothetical protein